MNATNDRFGNLDPTSPEHAEILSLRAPTGIPSRAFTSSAFFDPPTPAATAKPNAPAPAAIDPEQIAYDERRAELLGQLRAADAADRLRAEMLAQVGDSLAEPLRIADLQRVVDALGHRMHLRPEVAP